MVTTPLCKIRTEIILAEQTLDTSDPQIRYRSTQLLSHVISYRSKAVPLFHTDVKGRELELLLIFDLGIIRW
jgi:hypothetical protein